MFLFIVIGVVAIGVALMIDNAWWDWLRKTLFWVGLTIIAVGVALRYLDPT
jgi:hypothetical protein